MNADDSLEGLDDLLQSAWSGGEKGAPGEKAGDQIAGAAPADVLRRSVEAVAQLAECDRALLLLPTAEDWQIIAATGERASGAAGQRFDGSRTS